MAHPATPREALVELLTSYHELNVNFVEERKGAPTALEFLRCVQKNRPVVFKAAASHWKAVSAWNAEYLRAKMGSTSIVVAETPLGNADSAVVDEDGCTYFVKPHQLTTPFSDFLDDLRFQKANPKSTVVRYAQSQDDNMQREFGPIASDVECHISWASEALEKLPDAANVWMGNERSVSALHKDPYENLYVQITGRKHFVLISPFEAVCLKEKTLPSSKYQPSDRKGQFNIVPEEPPEDVHFWPTVDPDHPCGDNPWWEYCCPLRVELEPGDILYLPAMWYHKVSQRTCSDEGLCCAVNYWYDIEFAGPFFSAVNFARHVGLVASQGESKENEESVEGKVCR